jgi:hypothetical protein
MTYVSAATFERFTLDPEDDDPELLAELGWRVRVLLTGEGFSPRAASLVGQVGDVSIDHIVPVSDSQAEGFLREEPPVGAPLLLAWSGDELLDTGITYPGLPIV